MMSFVNTSKFCQVILKHFLKIAFGYDGTLGTLFLYMIVFITTEKSDFSEVILIFPCQI